MNTVGKAESMSDTWQEPSKELKKKRAERRQEHRRARREIQDYLRDEKWEDEEDTEIPEYEDELDLEDIEAAQKNGINLF